MFKRLFGNKNTNIPDLVEHREVSFDRKNISADAVKEAIDYLGLLKPTSSNVLLDLIPLCRIKGLKAVTTDFRKDGEQISKDEKKAIGVRSNGFFSRIAFEQLTEAGKSRAIEAHFLTLWRADATIHRASEIITATKDEHGYLKVIGEHANGCEVCRKHQQSKLSPFETSPFPPPQCAHDACCMQYIASIDWAAKAR